MIIEYIRISLIFACVDFSRQVINTFDGFLMSKFSSSEDLKITAVSMTVSYIGFYFIIASISIFSYNIGKMNLIKDHKDKSQGYASIIHAVILFAILSCVIWFGGLYFFGNKLIDIISVSKYSKQIIQYNQLYFTYFICESIGMVMVFIALAEGKNKQIFMLSIIRIIFICSFNYYNLLLFGEFYQNKYLAPILGYIIWSFINIAALLYIIRDYISIYDILGKFRNNIIFQNVKYLIRHGSIIGFVTALDSILWSFQFKYMTVHSQDIQLAFAMVFKFIVLCFSFAVGMSRAAILLIGKSIKQETLYPEASKTPSANVIIKKIMKIFGIFYIFWILIGIIFYILHIFILDFMYHNMIIKNPQIILIASKMCLVVSIMFVILANFKIMIYFLSSLKQSILVIMYSVLCYGSNIYISSSMHKLYIDNAYMAIIIPFLSIIIVNAIYLYITYSLSKKAIEQQISSNTYNI